MERTIPQQAQEMTQLHQTVGHLEWLVEARAAHEDAQRLGMMTWMQGREQEWDSRHEEDNLWEAGVTNMIAKTMKGVAQAQEGRENVKEMTSRTDCGGPEASQHPDTTREEGPEKRQQLQQQPKPTLQLKPQRNLHHVPKPKSAPTNTRLLGTVPPRAESQRAHIRPGPTPTAGSSMAVRRLLIRRDESVSLSNSMDQEIA